MISGEMKINVDKTVIMGDQMSDLMIKVSSGWQKKWLIDNDWFAQVALKNKK